jgi:hypothetical protein
LRMRVRMRVRVRVLLDGRRAHPAYALLITAFACTQLAGAAQRTPTALRGTRRA